MSSVCISNSCAVNDTRVPVRATYINLYKWPESDAEFVRWTVGRGNRPPQQHPRVVDSISCRQLYLRSYTFSREETVPERTKKCFDRVKERVVRGKRDKKKAEKKRRKRYTAARRIKEVSCTTLCAIFHRLLSCSATVDVVE